MEVEAYVRTGCTLMSDIWSDLKHHALINIIAHSPGGAVFMISFEISKEKKTGLYLIRDIVFSNSKYWG